MVQFRHILQKDLDVIRFWFNHSSVRGKIHLDESINSWLGITEEQMKSVFEKWSKEKDQTHMMVETVNTKTPVGLVMWDCQWDPHCPGINFFIAPDHHHQGYGSETLRLILNYLFDYTPAHSISAWISELDSDRFAFLKKLGFQDQGKMRRVAKVNGRDIGLHVLDLLKREWVAFRKKDS